MSIVQKVNVKLGEKVSECIQAINENKDHFDQHISTIYRHFFKGKSTSTF
jgi:hypothetical protein